MKTLHPLTALLPLLALALSGCQGFCPFPRWDRTGEYYPTTRNYMSRTTRYGEDACFLGKAGVQGGFLGGENAIIPLPLPSLIVAYPLMLAEWGTLAPLTDTLMLPRDLYVRTSQLNASERGVEVEVVDSSGRPVPDRPVAFFPHLPYGRTGYYYNGEFHERTFVTVLRTDANGRCRFPVALAPLEGYRFTTSAWTRDGLALTGSFEKASEDHFRLRLAPPDRDARASKSSRISTPAATSLLTLPADCRIIWRDRPDPNCVVRDHALQNHLENLYFNTSTNTCPADFDTYWSGERARLDHDVPFAVDLRPLPDRSTQTTEVFALAFPSFGRPVCGFLARPRRIAGTPVAKHPVHITIAPQKGEFTETSFTFREDAVSLALNVFPPAADDPANPGQRSKTSPHEYDPSYATQGISRSRESYFFHPVLLGAARGIRWLLDQEEVDPSRSRLEGIGQGAALGLWLMALEPQLAEGLFVNPSHLYQIQESSMNWPRLLWLFGDEAERRKLRALPNIPYFETQNFAPRVRGKVTLGCTTADSSKPNNFTYVTPQISDHAVFQGYRQLTGAAQKTLVYSPDLSEAELLERLRQFATGTDHTAAN